MRPPHHTIAALLLLAGLIAAPFSVRAAESYDNCAGFVDSLPATISTQGVWCLRHDLSTAITSGAAITIATNNVTIDCNDFKLSGAVAGTATQTSGIHAIARLNATVRHCNIRGFLAGVSLDGTGFVGGTGGGHVIEDNRLADNTYIGLSVTGDGSVLRRNQVTDTGGSTYLTGEAIGIYTFGAVDTFDNTISDVRPSASGGNGDAYGIWTSNNPSGGISANRVRGLVKLGTGGAYGIVNTDADRISLDGNHVVGDASGDIGLYCDDIHARARDNIVNGYATGISFCGNDGNVVVLP